jgi:hypothetical protein
MAQAVGDFVREVCPHRVRITAIAGNSFLPILTTPDSDTLRSSTPSAKEPQLLAY